MINSLENKCERKKRKEDIAGLSQARRRTVRLLTLPAWSTSPSSTFGRCQRVLGGRLKSTRHTVKYFCGKCPHCLISLIIENFSQDFSMEEENTKPPPLASKASRLASL
jgi:hypothetical protein